MVDQPQHGLNKILLVDPRHVLPPAGHRPAQAKAYETEQHREDPAAIGAEGECRAHEHPPGAWQIRPHRRRFPGLGYLDAETPRLRRIRLLTADDPGGLVIRPVKAMRINGGSAGL